MHTSKLYVTFAAFCLGSALTLPGMQHISRALGYHPEVASHEIHAGIHAKDQKERLHFISQRKPLPQIEDVISEALIGLTIDETQALDLHNRARSQVKVPSLKWDASLQAAAAAYAKSLAQRGVFEHSNSSSRPNQGENLAYAWSSGKITNPITQGTQGWLDERSVYKNETIPQGNFAGYGHYTQCVWNSTIRVGIATATDGKGAWYTVGRYSPPGNWVGQTPYRT